MSARTLQRTTASGRLTVRMRAALELRRLSEESATTNPRDEEANSELAQRLDHLEARVEELAGELRATRDAPSSPVIGERTTVETPSVKEPATSQPWRPYPQLITPEPEPGEELSTARRCRPSWRGARRGKSTARPRASWTSWMLRGTCGRLEIVLIRDHELTLPPASYPWDQFDRRDEVWGLERALADLKWERRWAVVLLWLRRALTLGVWWK